MEDVKRIARRATAERIIRKLAIRNMTGHYRDTAAEAVELAREFVEPGQSVTWGGSVSFFRERHQSGPGGRRPPHD